jgi:hypothetical protein
MTDRELLELAAKAAGIEIEWNAMINPHHPFLTPKTQQERNWLGHHHVTWNPLTNDGDAFRLAVKLGFMDSGVGWARVLCEIQQMVFPVKLDPCGATRRAIVRAAAEIGRSM